ncbi:MAG: hypothetical protein AAGF76_10945 [Pseudomonadota bacterium]
MDGAEGPAADPYSGDERRIALKSPPEGFGYPVFVDRVMVEEGEAVAAGRPVAIVVSRAGRRQVLAAPLDGTVRQIRHGYGDTLERRRVLMTLAVDPKVQPARPARPEQPTPEAPAGRRSARRDGKGAASADGPARGSAGGSSEGSSGRAGAASKRSAFGWRDGPAGDGAPSGAARDDPSARASNRSARRDRRRAEAAGAVRDTQAPGSGSDEASGAPIRDGAATEATARTRSVPTSRSAARPSSQPGSQPARAARGPRDILMVATPGHLRGLAPAATVGVGGMAWRLMLAAAISGTAFLLAAHVAYAFPAQRMAILMVPIALVSALMVGMTVVFHRRTRMGSRMGEVTLGLTAGIALLAAMQGMFYLAWAPDVLVLRPMIEIPALVAAIADLAG